MRYTKHVSALLTGACLLAATAAIAQAAPDAKPSDIDKVGDSAERMAVKPLKDLNLMKDEIPPEIQAIMNKPYDISKLKTCADLKNSVQRLTEVLGPDVDSVQATKKGENPAEFALGAAESVVGGLIPGMGLIRKIPGAEAAEKKAKAAVLAGQLRRAYIKGTAKARGCKV
ncbi:MAG: hypothetical protein ACOYLS_06430 [Polymorphobacter sp.]